MSAQAGSVTFIELQSDCEHYHSEKPVTRPQFTLSTHVLKCLNLYRTIAMWNSYCVNNADFSLKRLLFKILTLLAFSNFLMFLVSSQTTGAYFSHNM